MHDPKESPVAFVLSGGAGLGAIQVGMLRALYERGIEPDLIVATSAGAINGAFIATGRRPSRPPTRSPRSGAMSGAARSSRSTRSPACSASSARAPTSFPAPACAGSSPTPRADALEDLPIPLHVVAVDVITGEELLLSTGPLSRR